MFSLPCEVRAQRRVWESPLSDTLLLNYGCTHSKYETTTVQTYSLHPRERAISSATADSLINRVMGPAFASPALSQDDIRAMMRDTNSNHDIVTEIAAFEQKIADGSPSDIETSRRNIRKAVRLLCQAVQEQ